MPTRKPVFIINPKTPLLAIARAPKVGTTSTCTWLYNKGFGTNYESVQIKKLHGMKIHEYFRANQLNIKNSYIINALGIPRVALHRSPIDRIRSSYDHRVKQLKELPDRGIHDFVKKLKSYRQRNISIRHHTNPQTHTIGNNQDQYDIILPLSEIHLLKKIVEEMTKCKWPDFPHMQQSKIHSDFPDELVPDIKVFYKADYDAGWDGITTKLPF